ncbi:MAG: hypothetical protein ACLGHG_03030 [Gammaproteobacteria bacterium]
MSFTNSARALLTWLGLMLFALWLPVAVVAWLPGWHEGSCEWHAGCTEYGREAALARIAELRAYLQWRGELAVENWGDAERAYHAQVRNLLGYFSVLALLGAMVFAHADATLRARTARWAILLAAVCVIVLPFFGSFWRELFQPLTFGGAAHLREPDSTSAWIMPPIYYNYTTALVIGVATLICALARVQAMRQLTADDITSRADDPPSSRQS